MKQFLFHFHKMKNLIWYFLKEKREREESRGVWCFKEIKIISNFITYFIQSIEICEGYGANWSVDVWRRAGASLYKKFVRNPGHKMEHSADRSWSGFRSSRGFSRIQNCHCFSSLGQTRKRFCVPLKYVGSNKIHCLGHFRQWKQTLGLRIESILAALALIFWYESEKVIKGFRISIHSH